MYTEEVIKFFGSKTATAKALKISQVAVTRWGQLVPEKRALRIEKLTSGVLTYDPKLYDDYTEQQKRELNHENQSAD